ncbi:MAG: phosphatidylglycerophosphatase A [Panacagrimonas sp.]
MKPVSNKASRPPARLIMSTPEHCLAFGLGSGLAPVAPGTVGSLLGVPVWLMLCWMPLEWHLGAVALLVVLGVWICGESARMLGVGDDPGIVLDEIAGFQIAALPLLPALAISGLPLWLGLLLAFVLFRVFDIAKPWPISWFDRNLHGGLGIMLDDLLAGLFAASALWGSVHVFNSLS